MKLCGDRLPSGVFSILPCARNPREQQQLSRVYDSSHPSGFICISTKNIYNLSEKTTRCRTALRENHAKFITHPRFPVSAPTKDAGGLTHQTALNQLNYVFLRISATARYCFNDTPMTISMLAGSSTSWFFAVMMPEFLSSATAASATP